MEQELKDNQKPSEATIWSYSSHYSENGFWTKISSVAKKAGEKTLKQAFVVYELSMSDKVSVADKALIFGALGYFILPIDLLPDLIPVAGYADDVAALMIVINKLRNLITPEIEKAAEDRVKQWLA